MLPGPLVRLADAPERSALLFDVDGTLAPIVARPEDARVPSETREELRRLISRYRIVGCLSGRTGRDAARVVGVEEVVYVGAHGLELSDDAAAWSDRLRGFAANAGWPVEDKGVTVSFHYRGAPDELRARAQLERVAERARAAGLVARFGRKVLELRPPVEVDKGTAVRRLLDGQPVVHALYAGDDTTDLDAFRGLREAGLETAVRIAVAADEGPAQLRREADVVVDGPASLLALLRQL